MDTVYEFMNGRCHDFALGLASFLRSQGVYSQLLVQTVTHPGDERGSYTHAVLKVGAHTYDINGSKAKPGVDREVCPVGQVSRWVAMLPERQQFLAMLPFLANGAGTACYANVATKVSIALKTLAQERAREEGADKAQPGR